ncbi:MAG: hypothetical protein ACRDTD_13880 [Pseudonocardiaceae bacterium]
MTGDQGTELRSPVELPSIWWRTLRESLRILAVVLTRMYLTENEVARRLRVFFGDRADPAVSEWTAAHADLHWANLIGPGLIILDWEGRGIALVGFDAATLYLHSLLRPAIAKQVRAEFNELLEHRDGLTLPSALHRNAERVLQRQRALCRSLAVGPQQGARPVVGDQPRRVANRGASGFPMTRSIG